MQNAVDSLPTRVLSAFLDRCGSLARNITLLSNPTEEIDDAIANRRKVKLFQRGPRTLSMAQSVGAKARLEENYLFDTRNFQSGTLAASEFIFFQNAQGGNPTNNGFPAGVTVMSDVETNMDTPGQIAQGKNYVFNQIGITFNVDISHADLTIMLESGALRYEKQGGQYTLRHGVIKMWPGGVGISGYAAAFDAATSITNSSNGVADIRTARRLAIPRIIKEKDSFAYKYVVPRAVRNTDGTTATTLGADLIMGIYLWGGQQDSIPV